MTHRYQKDNNNRIYILSVGIASTGFYRCRGLPKLHLLAPATLGLAPNPRVHLRLHYKKV
jgi:hypothetical protein